jgi:hypothetical protein
MLAALWLTGCGSDSDSDAEGLPIPVPDSFDAYFVAGSVCMPSNLATGSVGPRTAPTYPIRFDICTHRCISLDRGTTFLQQSFQCGGGQCNMMMLARARAYRVQSEMNCDGRELPNPPAGECTPESFTFSNIDPPCCLDGDNYVTGDMQVGVPFMDLDQADEVSRRVAAGENPQTVILQVVGPPPAERQWRINLDPGHAAVSDGAALSGADCHPIPAP